MQLFYNGTDIYGDISISSCIHDMYADSHTDELTVKFNDTRHLWDNWQPSQTDTVSLVDGAARSGEMYVQDIAPENGLMVLRAYSIPPTAKDPSSKSWEKVRLFGLGQEIAGRHGLSFETYNVDDQLYQYVRQNNMPDFAFWEQRCALEGLSFLVYDKRLITYSESALESETPAESLLITAADRFEYTDNAREAYGRAELINGRFTGTFTAPGGSDKLFRKILQVKIMEQGEGNRFAKSILRRENKNKVTGILWTDIKRQYAAGSMVNLETEAVPSWNGPAFLYHVRHDYTKGLSKLFFRKPLEGY